MNRSIHILIYILLASVYAANNIWGCTSAIISGKANPEGRTLLWKHRDTGHEHNFVARVSPTGHSLGYVALFNGGDSLLNEAWIGMNEAGFAIMNTASYNLAPDTAAYNAAVHSSTSSISSIHFPARWAYRPISAPSMLLEPEHITKQTTIDM